MRLEPRPNGLFEQRPEHWWEWLKVIVAKEIAEGGFAPRFYLPVRWKGPSDLNVLEYWIFPLAPFVLAGLIFARLLRAGWRDVVEWLFLLTRYEHTNADYWHKRAREAERELFNLECPQLKGKL